MQRLQAMRDAGEKIILLPRLGNDVFARGTPERPRTRTITTYDATLFDLLKAYGRQRAQAGPQNLQIRRTELFSVDQAVARLARMLGAVPGWRTLASFLPPDLRGDPLLRRSALASTFAATLEMCKAGKLRIRQEGTFGTIYLRSAAEDQQEQS
jgi:segregation and condensation protein A